MLTWSIWTSCPQLPPTSFSRARLARPIRNGRKRKHQTIRRQPSGAPVEWLFYLFLLTCYSGTEPQVLCQAWFYYGIRQGGISSPYVFTMYIDDLSNMLNNAGIS